MRVLMINSVCGIRSTGRICTDLASALIEEGHIAKVAYARGSVPTEYQSISQKIGTTFDVYKQALMTRLFDCEGFGNKSSTKRFIEWIKYFEPDIIHLHNIHGYYINLELLFKFLKEYQKPVIWTLHDCWCFTGHCAYFDFVGCNKWLSQCGNCPQKKSYPASFFLDRSKTNFERKKKAFKGIKDLFLVTPSKWLANLLSKSFLRDYPITVIPNGINIDVFKPRVNNIKEKLGIKDKVMLLGVASVWDRRKGFETFLELSQRLNENYVIVLIGLPKDKIAALPKNMIGVESTNNTLELAEYYSAADVFVNPTTEDNYPTTNLEAIACGTPVVTYDTGGSPESAVMFGTSVGKDIGELIKAIKAYKNYKPKQFDLDCHSMLKKYLRLYHKLK